MVSGWDFSLVILTPEITYVMLGWTIGPAIEVKAFCHGADSMPLASLIAYGSNRSTFQGNNPSQ